jgi:hypothetical protein
MAERRAPRTKCPGRMQEAQRTREGGPEAFLGAGAPMRVRTRVTAGTHIVGATFLATQYAPLLDLDVTFRRSTIQTGPTPGYTFFPHVGTVRIEGPFARCMRRARRAGGSCSSARRHGRPTERRCARRSSRTSRPTRSAQDRSRHSMSSVMELLSRRDAGEGFRAWRRDGAGARVLPRRSSSIASKKSRQRVAAGRATASATSISLAAVVLPVEQSSR